MAKEFLSQSRIHYTEKDVNTDPEGRQLMMKHKLTGVPAFIIGSDIIVGLDKERILKLVDHRLETCPNCKAKLRVPTGQGQVSVTCPKCKTKIR